MAHFPQNGAEIRGDLPADGRGHAGPDVAGLDGHAASRSPASRTSAASASGVSLVSPARRSGTGSRLVADSGSRVVMPGWYSTQANPSECNVLVTDTSRNRRPNSG